jgi:mRNA-degrading endonuclease HigB of HigAB toxin-antitoxin module
MGSSPSWDKPKTIKSVFPKHAALKRKSQDSLESGGKEKKAVMLFVQNLYDNVFIVRILHFGGNNL